MGSHRRNENPDQDSTTRLAYRLVELPCGAGYYGHSEPRRPYGMTSLYRTYFSNLPVSGT